jgi:hypothetical protein
VESVHRQPNWENHDQRREMLAWYALDRPERAGVSHLLHMAFRLVHGGS